uniref:Metalloendopeptidase n=1 Tax=Crassostrea virginica TaxID=6565 RepID=A0A8B8CSG6_CRAVI|nr:zinc metalloproteinase nas-4-like [Crassostrea virginica]
MQLLLVALVISLANARPQPEVPVGFDPAYPEENPGLFEGDIELQPEQESNLRNAIGDTRYLWPHGLVHYTIDSHHAAIPSHVQLFKDAMQEIMDKTMVNGKKCIDFQPRTSEAAYIQFSYGSGCHTPVGYQHRRSDVTLGTGCLRKGTVMHEILHALGFWHEQSRADRDNYVKIHFDNIQHGHERNFDKYQVGPKLDMLNEPYDYGSVMHYSAYAFAVDRRRVTIETLQPGVTIGQRVRLSDIDAKEIQIRYGCIPRPGSVQSTHSQQSVHVTTPHSITNQASVCTFDSGLCGWTQSKTDDLDWTDGHGRTPSSNTGPTTDHFGSTSGHYLYMEASSHYQKTAKLDSPVYPGGQYCLSAYFHMYGQQTGYLAFNIIQNGQKYVVKRYSGDHGNRWLHMRLSINIRSSSFQFEMEGHTGSGYHSDIAIDDLSVTQGHC